MTFSEKKFSPKKFNPFLQTDFISRIVHSLFEKVSQF